ncbi:MAG TPA: amino acid permease [Vicinamibacteria bacterium]|nr:amino acid permease [Vicinamibacteria bacterium]
MASASESRPHLVRDLNLAHALAINAGTMIGTGIFIVPQSIAASVETAGWILGVWVVASLLAMLGAFTYAELGAAIPRAGGDYVYIRDAFGRRAGFLFGWTQLLVARSGSIAALAAGVSIQLGDFLNLGTGGQKIAALAAIALLTGINIRGVRSGGNVQVLFTVLKIGALLLLISLAFTSDSGSAANFSPLFSPGIELGFIGLFGLALVDALWAYDGWNDVNLTAGEVKDPKRNIPRAMLGSIGLVMLVYMLANLAYLYILPASSQAASERVAADVARAVLGDSGARFINLAILLSMFGALNGSILSGARIFYAMADDGLFFRKFASVHPRFFTPAVALVGQALWAAVLVAFAVYRQLTTYVVFASWVFYALSSLALIRLRRTRPDLDRPYRAWGYPYSQILFVIAATGIILNTLWVSPRESMIGLAIIALGVPVFWIWESRRVEK